MISRLGSHLHWVGLVGVGLAALIGLLGDHLAPVIIGILSLLPLASHIRWVGWRRAVAEPSVVTVIVYFYVLVFPLRALVIAASHYNDINLVPGTVTPSNLTTTLLQASLGTTLFLEAFHYVRRIPHSTVAAGAPAVYPHQPERRQRTPRSSINTLALGLGALSLGALVILVFKNHGISGVQAQYLSHSKATNLSGVSKFALSCWTTVAIPAVWCAVCAAMPQGATRIRRTTYLLMAGVIVLAQLIVFGSRLDALLSLMGAWAVLHYSGREISAVRILATIPVILLVSVPILSQRPGGDLQNISPIERYSRIAGYSILDSSLAVNQQPEVVKAKLRDPSRWFDLPLYLVPSAVWPSKPNLDSRRLDLYVAQTLGNQNQQQTGFPASYLTEIRLYGGWFAIVLVSVVLGAIVGRLHRALVGKTRERSDASLILYAFVLASAFSYYKDGDILMTLVSVIRTGTYLALGMVITGVWSPFGWSWRRRAKSDDLVAGRELSVTAYR